MDEGEHSPAKPTRTVPRGLALDAEIFQRLLRSQHVAAIARNMGAKVQTVSDRTSRMVRLGYVREVAPGARPALYARGSRAAEFEAVLASTDSDHGVRSGHALAGRLHHLRFVWRIENGPAREPAWTRHWRASAVNFFESEVQQRGRTYIVRETRGKSKSSFRVTAPEEYVSDPAMLDLQERQVLHEVADLLRSFAQEHGYVLDRAGLQVSGGSEVGLPVAEWVPKFGRAGEPVTVDASLPPRELDIRPKEVVRAVLGLPKELAEDQAHRASVDARLAAMDAKFEAEHERGQRILKALERSLGLHEQHNLAMLALAEAHLKNGEPTRPVLSPSPNPYNGSEYA